MQNYNSKLKIGSIFFIIAIILIPTFWILISINHVIAKDNNENKSCDYALVSKVVDGDTVKLSSGETVRLIGIDTPETVDPRKEVQYFGKEASNKLKSLVANKKVCLKTDNADSNKDKYGRLLRYIWLDNAFINAEMIKQGYAFAYVRFPFQYLQDFKTFQFQARDKGAGLWNKKARQVFDKNQVDAKQSALACGIDGTICPEKAIKYVGKNITIRFRVAKSYDSGKAIFFDSKNSFKDPDNFTAIIFNSDKKKFIADPVNFYKGKVIDVKGVIKKYNGKAEMILDNSGQIKISKQ